MTIKIPTGPKKISVQRKSTPKPAERKEDPRWERYRRALIFMVLGFLVLGLALIPFVGIVPVFKGFYVLILLLSLFATQMGPGRSGFWQTILVLIFIFLAPHLATTRLAAVLVVTAWIFLLVILAFRIWPSFKSETPTWRAAVLLGLVLATQVLLANISQVQGFIRSQKTREEIRRVNEERRQQELWEETDSSLPKNRDGKWAHERHENHEKFPVRIR